MKQEGFIVYTAEGSYDYVERRKFVTFDEQKASEWCEKFNRIIESNRNRMMDFDEDIIEETVLPLWYFKLLYEYPVAYYRKIEIR